MSVSNSPGQHGIDDFEPAGSADTEYISDFVRLPGQWESREECEEVQPLGFCQDGDPQLGTKRQCGSRKCPMHWNQWRKSAVKAIVKRLAAYRATQEGKGRRLLHTVAAPDPEQRWTIQRFWKTRKKVYELFQEHGGRGGTAIPHGFRPTDEAKGIFGSAVDNGFDREKGIWRFLRGFSEDWKDLRNYLDVSPHVHGMVAWEDLDGDKLEDELPEGWVIHNVRSLSSFFLDESEVPAYYQLDDNMKIERTKQEVVREGYEDMIRLGMYLLSHSAVQIPAGEGIDRKQTVTYFGDVHPNSFDPSEELGEEDLAKIEHTVDALVGNGDVALEEEQDDTMAPGDVCQCEDCEQPVYGLEKLADYMARPEWVNGLEPEQRCQMVGLKVYLGDSPSPGTGGKGAGPPPGGFNRSAASADPGLTGRAGFREWLRQLGRRRIQQHPFYDVSDIDGVEPFGSANA